MGSKTKIVVLQVKELIYTAIFVGLGIFLILLLIFMFSPGKEKDKDKIVTPTMEYNAGVYTSSVMINDHTVNIEIVVDGDNVNDVKIVNLDETVATMYPLLNPSLDEIASQLCSGVPLDEITYSSDKQYTSTILLQGIEQTLKKAQIQKK